MNLFRAIWSRFRSLGQNRVVKQEIDDELSFHLEQRTAENIARGMSPEEAAREARKRFGNFQSVREECREVRGADFGRGMLQDLLFNSRVLAKSPGFTIVAVLMLAIGIGSVTAMFSVMRTLIIKPFSSPNGERLVYVWSNEGRTVSTLDYFDILDQATSFSELGAYGLQHVTLDEDHPVSLYSAFCTPGVLRAFGVTPVLGRWLEPGDEQPGAAPVVVISHRLWQRSFAGDPRMIGRTIRLNGSNVTVVGIMPAGFEFFSPWAWPNTFDVWRPLQLQRDQVSRDTGWWLVVGCLKKGVTFDAANAEIKAIGARLKVAYPDTNVKKPFLLTTLRFEKTRYASSYAWMIFGATALMLLVACVNIASMLLARNARRSGEFGVRIALGATRGRILRLVFAESLLISLAGAIVGAGLAAFGLHCLKFLEVDPDAPRTALVLNGYALAFAAGLSLLTALLAGFPPAFAALRIPVASLLRTDSRGAAGSGARHRLLRGLIITQIAVAFILANVAVIFSASYAKLIAANASVASDYVLSAEVNFCDARYRKNDVLARSCEQLAERVAALPGVAAAGFTSQLPFEAGASQSILVNDEVFDPATERTVAATSEITPGYFAAAGIPLLQGRTLRTDSTGTNVNDVVVNLALAEKCWPGQDPLGKIIRPNAADTWFHVRIVGVVGNFRRFAGETEPPPQMYWSADRAWSKTTYLVVRSQRPGTAFAPELRHAFAEFDPGLPLSRVRTLKTVFREATEDAHAVAWLADYCMIVAIGLVAVGLYGTLSYHVLQRTREIGLRMALGATRRDIVRLIFCQGFGWVLIGIVIGIGGVLASAKTLRAMVYDINTLNPLCLVVSAGAVILAVALACWLPARRAMNIQPMEALRCE
jgi:predicted permease